VLEDEWLRTVDERGWRLPPDVLVGLLRRHRGDGPRRAAVMQMAGPVGPWILDHLPELASVGGARATRALTPAGPSAALPVSPELVPLLDAEPAAVVTALAGGLDSCTFGPPHRAVLINFVARCRPEALEPLAVALRAVESPSAGIAHLLADLAATRHAMITELAP
jgi:hypothetical protein